MSTSPAEANREVPQGSARPFVFARDHGERAEEINAFYNGFMGLSRSLQAYKWEFQEGPGGPALIWTIVEAASDRVVGHHSIISTPMVRRGQPLAAGRTENTIIAPAVRTKVFYPGMEKRALAEALEGLQVIYTIHSKGPGRLRARLGYKPVGRWVAYLPRVGPAYLEALLTRAVERLRMRLARTAVVGLARVSASIHHALMPREMPAGVEVTEIDDIAMIAEEYDSLWAAARREYDATIDRSLAFLQWRVSDNPHLSFRTWTLRRGGALLGVVIGHLHRIGAASALYVDDVIARKYEDEDFDVAVRCLGGLAPEAESVVVMTLAVDTPLHRVLRRRFPLQARAMDRLSERLFDDLLALDTTTDRIEPWYVTAIFTEGMDTSRESAG